MTERNIGQQAAIGPGRHFHVSPVAVIIYLGEGRYYYGFYAQCQGVTQVCIGLVRIHLPLNDIPPNIIAA